ncbi:MAG: hypothetical protein Q8K70_04965 [Bacteroidota bacterium]|nr:hypothetical protein [Bacteroidota bacterium]
MKLKIIINSMTKRILAFTLLLISINTFAQNDTRKPYSDTTFTDRKTNKFSQIKDFDGVKTTTTKFYSGGNLKSIEIHENHKPIGKHQFWYNSGLLNSETIYINGVKSSHKQWFENGILSIEYQNFVTPDNTSRRYNSSQFHGKYLENYPNGHNKVTRFYDSGLQTGKWVSYYENGHKSFQADYKYGLSSGELKKWYPNGKLSQFENFKIIENNNIASNNQLSSTQQNSSPKYKSVKHGKQAYYFENGKESQISQFKLGINDGTNKKWGKNGQLEIWAEYKNGKIHGKNYLYYSNGKPKQIIQEYYDWDLKTVYINGKYEKYFQNGNPEIIAFYKNRKIDGLYQNFHENGNKRIVCKYQNGQLIGQYTEYKINGDIYKSAFYIQSGNPKQALLDGDYIENQTIGKYSNGKRQGVWKTWNGTQLISEMQYCNGKICGTTKMWHTDGKLSEERFYSPVDNHMTKNILYSNNTNQKINYYNSEGSSIKEIFYQNSSIASVVYNLGSGNKLFSNSKLTRKLEFFNNGLLKYDKHFIDNTNIGVSFTYYYNGKPMLLENNSHPNDKTNRYYVLWDINGNFVECLGADNKKKALSTQDAMKMYNLALKNSINNQYIQTDNNRIENISPHVKVDYKEVVENTESIYVYQLNYWNDDPCIIYNFKDNLPDGRYEYRSNNGTKINEGACSKGNKTGKWITKRNDNTIEKEQLFIKDTIYNKKYYPSEKIQDISSQKGYKLFGDLTTFYENGNKQSKITYFNGIIEDSSLRWYENGVLQNITIYVNNKKSGSYKDYWNNGNKKIIGNYLDNKQIDIWEYYNEDETPYADIDYANNNKSLYFFYNDCNCNQSKIEIPNNLTEALPYISIDERFKKYFDTKNGFIGMMNIQKSKNTDEETVTFTAYYNERNITSQNRYSNGKLGFVLNPCYQPKNKAAAIPFEITKNKNRSTLTAKVNNMSYYFSRSLISPYQKNNHSYGFSNEYSSLSWKLNELKISNDSLFFKSPSNFCFLKSRINGTDILFNFDTSEYYHNHPYNLTGRSDTLSIQDNFKNFIIKNNFYYRNSFYFEANNTQFNFPETLLDSGLTEINYLDLNGQIRLSEKELYASINFKANNIQNNEFEILYNNKIYRINILSFLEKIKKKTSTYYHFNTVNYYYSTETKELSIFLHKKI